MGGIPTLFLCQFPVKKCKMLVVERISRVALTRKNVDVIAC